MTPSSLRYRNYYRLKQASLRFLDVKKGSPAAGYQSPTLVFIGKSYDSVDSHACATLEADLPEYA